MIFRHPLASLQWCIWVAGPGIPQCEGVTKIVGACGMLGITLALVRILNYDAFGLIIENLLYT